MDAALVGPEAHPLAHPDAEFADAARGQGADLRHIHIDEGVAAEMLGDAHGAFPALAVAGYGDVLGPDADRRGAELAGRCLADKVHLRRADEARDEEIGRMLVEF